MPQEEASEKYLLNGQAEQHLTQVFSKYHSQVDSAMQIEFPRKDTKINTMLKYFLGWTDPSGFATNKSISGKALRPILCILACNAAGGDVQTAIHASIPLEFIHNFSLIHDDIQDKDKLRHNRPTIWALWGNPKALIAGNNLRVIADITMNNLIRTGLSANKCLKLNYILTQACLEMIEGQYLDIKYEGQTSLTTELYLEMISKKTGALIASGKSVGADIIRKKNSLPIIITATNTTKINQKKIISIYNKQSISQSDLNEVLNIMDETKSKQQCMDLAEIYCRQALSSIDDISMSDESRKDIESVALFLTKRQH